MTYIFPLFCCLHIQQHKPITQQNKHIMSITAVIRMYAVVAPLGVIPNGQASSLFFEGIAGLSSFDVVVVALGSMYSNIYKYIICIHS